MIHVICVCMYFCYQIRNFSVINTKHTGTRSPNGDRKLSLLRFGVRCDLRLG